MTTTPDPIDQLLDRTTPRLSADRETVLWSRIAERITRPATPSPYQSFFLRRTWVAGLAGLLVLLVGSTSVVTAANAARPGDVLFPLEQALERARLALASEADAAGLRASFTSERLAELQALIDESATVLTEVAVTPTTTLRSFYAEADVFTDLTVVTVERNDEQVTFTTSATTRDGVIDEIVQRFGVDRTLVDDRLDFEAEDRASRPGERGPLVVDVAYEARISLAVDMVIEHLEAVADDERGAYLRELERELRGLQSEPVRSRVPAEVYEIRRRDDRVEIRTDDYRVRIDDDGSVRVRENDDDDDDDEYEVSGRGSAEQADAFDEIEIEAEVFGDRTVVTVERNDDETSFTTSATTREAVIDEVVRRYGLSRTLVAARLEFTVEDRVDRSEREEQTTHHEDDDQADDDDHSSMVDDEDESGDDNERDHDESSHDNDQSSGEDDETEDKVVEQFEVRVKAGVAEVRLEVRGRRFEYVSVHTTASALVAEAAVRTGTAAAALEVALDLEYDD